MFLLPLLIAATTLTPTPTLAPSPTPTTTDEIQKIRDVVQQKVKEKIQQITQPTLTKKGLIGKIITLDSKNITIEYLDTTTTATLDETTVVIDQKRNKITIDKLKIGQDILVLGEQISDTEFVAKRIVVFEIKSIEIKTVVLIGKIADISKTTSLFSLIPSKDKNSQYQVKTDSKTTVFSPSGDKIPINQLKSGHKIIVILDPDPKLSKTYYAQKIFDLDYTPSPTPTQKP